VTDHLPAGLEDRVRDAYQSAAQTVQPTALRRTSPMLAAGSVPRSRRINAFVPIAAAIAVLVVIGASVALPRLLTGAAQNPAAPGISASAPRHYPPFRVVVTVSDSNRESGLLVESAASGHVVSTVAPPWQGGMWIAVAATAAATRFIAAAEPASSPYTPTRLYALTLSAHGTVTGLTPLAVPTLPGELTSLAASADGSTVAYTTSGPGAGYEVGVIAGGRTRHWSVPAGVIAGIWHVSVSSDGRMLAFTSQSVARGGVEDAAWVLPTGSAPGSLTARARKIYDHWYVGGAGHAMTILQSALISQDGSTLYLCTSATSASGRTVTMVAAASTADGASLGTISAWENGYPEMLSPVGGVLLSWDQNSSTAYLINPATRTRTTLRLRGIPRAQYVTLAW
jgi:WD40-like Beta Propeller Repeat